MSAKPESAADDFAWVLGVWLFLIVFNVAVSWLQKSL